MTNEELAVHINKDSPELIPILWERIHKFMYSEARRYYGTYKTSCERCGVALDDIKQECYPAFLNAVKAYSNQSEHSFVSYLKYPFKNAINTLMGLRTEAGKQTPLNNATSLDKPISNLESDFETTLIDTLIDETSQEPFYDIEETDVQRIVWGEVQKLEDRQRAIITSMFFENKTLKAIGDEICLSQERVRQIKDKALLILKKSTQLKEVYKDFQYHYQWNSLSHFKYSPQYFDIVQEIEKRECQGEFISCGKKQALICSSEQEYRKTNLRCS